MPRASGVMTAAFSERISRNRVAERLLRCIGSGRTDSLKQYIAGGSLDTSVEEPEKAPITISTMTVKSCAGKDPSGNVENLRFLRTHW